MAFYVVEITNLNPSSLNSSYGDVMFEVQEAESGKAGTSKNWNNKSYVYSDDEYETEEEAAAALEASDFDYPTMTEAQTEEHLCVAVNESISATTTDSEIQELVGTWLVDEADVTQVEAYIRVETAERMCKERREELLNQSLASKVMNILLSGKPVRGINYTYDENFVELLISEHQNRFPGAWQVWNSDVKAKKFAAIVRRASKAGETSVGRILLNCI